MKNDGNDQGTKNLTICVKKFNNLLSIVPNLWHQQEYLETNKGYNLEYQNDMSSEVEIDL